MKTAIIIATHKRAAMVERLLKNLSSCAFPEDVEIYVVENGPRSGVEKVVQEHTVGDRVRYLYRPVGNKALALNHAVEESLADFLIFLDDDVTVPSEIVQTYVDAARRRGPGHFFGGGLVADAEVECPPHLLPYLPRSAKGWSFSPHEAEIPLSEFDFFFGANWAAFRRDLEGCGLFSPELGITQSRYSSVGEETELQRRLLYCGGRAIYLPRATILHPVSAECYTAPWLRRRRFRLGVAEWVTLHSQTAGPQRRIFGLPLWVLRSLVQQRLHRLSQLLAGSPIEARTESSMEEAHLMGLLYGAWAEQDRRRGLFGRDRQAALH